MEKINFLSSLKLLWNPSLRSKCQQWQEMNSLGVLFPCDEERRGMVSEMSESVHDEVQVIRFQSITGNIHAKILAC